MVNKRGVSAARPHGGQEIRKKREGPGVSFTKHIFLKTQAHTHTPYERERERKTERKRQKERERERERREKVRNVDVFQKRKKKINLFMCFTL
jgi:hypothetical protein